ncbi:OmpH family outer membrane protein [Adhaeribacter rhizoryzae]|uniref:OmpH family outer membrane protein n=1 Tax=Adhaeribacter rhizoryzae TaxID=2607907 RepID=A0A5M6D7M3_9BACT|nr:OmpH family outer membrane protein [Adhaeribacter rhizoryzae]KAA5542480.1 OmpH family outer membrane protein [Adhaeribacter rhizoryzae]
MKRPFLVLALSLSVAGTTLFTGCQQKGGDAGKTTTPNTAVTADSGAVATTETSATSTPAATATPTTATAPNQKFGYINSAELLKVMPETKRAEANLEAFVKNLEKQFGGLQSEYQTKITEFQSQEKTMVDAVKETRIRALQDLEQRLQQSQVSGQQQVAKKREDLFKPILDKAEKAVKDVGKENGYDYIFDTNTGSFIYAKESHNIMPLVKAKLGIK